MQIYVGSINPVKINAVTNATSETWPEVSVKGFSVESGIPEQPLTNEITKQGAENRARAVLEIAEKQGIGQSGNKNSTTIITIKNIEKDFLAVGLEGGVFTDDNGVMWTTVWAAVIDFDGNLHMANGARFRVPQIIVDRISQGKEMGPVVAQIVGEDNIKEKQGMIGVVTQGFVDRTEEYTGIVKMALGLWYGRDWDKNL